MLWRYKRSNSACSSTSKVPSHFVSCLCMELHLTHFCCISPSFSKAVRVVRRFSLVERIAVLLEPIHLGFLLDCFSHLRRQISLQLFIHNYIHLFSFLLLVRAERPRIDEQLFLMPFLSSFLSICTKKTTSEVFFTS